MKTKQIRVDLWQNMDGKIQSMEISIRKLTLLLRNPDHEIASTLKSILQEIEENNKKVDNEKTN